MVYGNLIWRDEQINAQPLVSNESFQFRIFAENYIDAFALVDRIQLLDAGGYLAQDEVHAREDWELYLHLAAVGRRITFVPLVFGNYYSLPNSMIKDASSNYEAQQRYIRRVFDQLGIRNWLLANTDRLRYHPDLGYL